MNGDRTSATSPVVPPSRDPPRRSGTPPSSTGSRSSGEVVEAYLTIFGAPPSPVTVTVFEPGLGRRVWRAAVPCLVCWALALASVFIVLAHFILVPGFLVAGPVLAYVRFRMVRVVRKVHGACPRCRIEQDFKPPSWGRTIDCARCKNQLVLTGLDGEGLPTSTGDPTRTQRW